MLAEPHLRFAGRGFQGEQGLTAIRAFVEPNMYMDASIRRVGDVRERRGHEEL